MPTSDVLAVWSLKALHGQHGVAKPAARLDAHLHLLHENGTGLHGESPLLLQ